MIISRKDECLLTGFVIADQKEKEYDGKQFVEIAVNVGKDEHGEDRPLISVTVWRKMYPFKKGDHVLATGKLKITQKDDKTYYSVTADFITKEEVVEVNSKPAPDLIPIDDDDSLPF